MVQAHNRALYICKREWGRCLQTDMEWFLGILFSEKAKYKRVYAMFCIRKKGTWENIHVSVFDQKGKQEE